MGTDNYQLDRFNSEECITQRCMKFIQDLMNQKFNFFEVKCKRLHISTSCWRGKYNAIIIKNLINISKGQTCCYIIPFSQLFRYSLLILCFFFSLISSLTPMRNSLTAVNSMFEVVEMHIAVAS